MTAPTPTRDNLRLTTLTDILARATIDPDTDTEGTNGDKALGALHEIANWFVECISDFDADDGNGFADAVMRARREMTERERERLIGVLATAKTHSRRTVAVVTELLLAPEPPFEVDDSASPQAEPPHVPIIIDGQGTLRKVM